MNGSEVAGKLAKEYLTIISSYPGIEVDKKLKFL
jgi:hypothetical protein